MAFVSPCVSAALGRSTFANARSCTPARRPYARAPGARHARVTATLGEKFGNLRNADIPSVSNTVTKFANSFGRPVPIVYRAVVNELLTTTHLASVTAMWEYDVIFAFGFESVFTSFLSFYPDAAERETLRNAVATALGFDPAKLAADAEAVLNWIDPVSTYDELVAKLEAAPADDVVASALRAPQKTESFEYYYSRCYGLGLISLMQKVGDEATIETAEKWAKLVGLEASKLTAEVGVYSSAMERLKQAEQIFAEAAAREAKKTADRLAKRAEEAAKKLEEIEKGEAAAPAAEGEEVAASNGSTPTTSTVTAKEEKSS